jgi:hypothetical protein
MLNGLIEIHDTRVTDIRTAGEDVVLVVDAYVHESAGRPGIDPGAGFSQHAELVFQRARILERPDGSTLWITGGMLTSTNRTFDNLLPIPFQLAEPLEFFAEGADGRLRIVAESAQLVLIGEPRFIEYVDGL